MVDAGCSSDAMLKLQDFKLSNECEERPIVARELSRIVMSSFLPPSRQEERSGKSFALALSLWHAVAQWTGLTCFFTLSDRLVRWSSIFLADYPELAVLLLVDEPVRVSLSGLAIERLSRSVGLNHCEGVLAVADLTHLA